MFGKYVPDGLKSALSPLSPVYDAWMWLISGFSWLLIRVMLVLLFFTVFTIYGVVLRILRRDPMNRHLDPDADSYWTGSVKVNGAKNDFEKQY